MKNIEDIEPFELPKDFNWEMTPPDDLAPWVLPLTPQDLVSIYKEKEEEDDGEFVLWVDYVKSREKLTPQHLLIYLANTNFKASFAQVDEDLILEYIKTDFMVDSPTLDRIVANIIKRRYQHQISDLEGMMYKLFGLNQIDAFIQTHSELVDELCIGMISAVPFILTKLAGALSEEDLQKETNLIDICAQIKTIDKPSNLGPNVANFVNTIFDAFCCILSEEGFVLEYNKQLYNDSPKFFGKDVYNVFCETGITANIIEFLPPGFLIGNDSTSK